MYIYEHKNWPKFTWSLPELQPHLEEIRVMQARLLGRMESLGLKWQQETVLNTMTLDVLKTSEIEGEILDLAQVRSSLARRLGIEVAALKPSDRHVDGVVEMLLDASRNYKKTLSKKRLFDWHAALFPTGRSHMTRIRVGSWRDDSKGPMQVVSGVFGKERVHFQAPAAKKIEREVKQFLKWFEGSQKLDPILKAAIAHLWFVTLHPFDDGNGRIARAIADLALARAEKSALRFYSMSAQIREERNSYYEILEQTQSGSLDITRWLEWFLQCLMRALNSSEKTLKVVIEKARFWEKAAVYTLSSRQQRMLNLLLDGFEGKLTSSKWAKITKCSQDTASRDINGLIEFGLLKKDEGGGRSTSYSLFCQRL